MKKTLLTLMTFVLSFGFCFANPKANPDEGMWLPMFFKQLNHSTMQKMGLKLTAEEL